MMITASSRKIGRTSLKRFAAVLGNVKRKSKSCKVKWRRLIKMEQWGRRIALGILCWFLMRHVALIVNFASSANTCKTSGKTSTKKNP